MLTVSFQKTPKLRTGPQTDFVHGSHVVTRATRQPPDVTLMQCADQS